MKRLISLCMVGVLMSAASAFGAAMLTDIGVLDLGSPESAVHAITPDGTYAVGYSNDGAGVQQPIIYDAVNGMQQILNPLPAVAAQAWGVVLVPNGGSSNPTGAPAVGIGLNLNNQMYRYKALQSNLTGGQYYTNIFGASGVIGSYNASCSQTGHSTERWFTGGQRLTGTRRGFNDALDGSGAMDAQNVGHCMINSQGGSGYSGGVGWDSGNPGGAHRAVRFTGVNGTVQTVIPGDAGVNCEGFGISKDVNWSCGFDTNVAGGTQAFKWDKDDAAMTLMGTLAGDTDACAIDINDAGAAVGYSAGNIEQAVIWDAGGQIAVLQAVLNSAGVDTSAWSSLTRATSMTDDGLTIGGYGVWAADSSTRGFVATIPEPATLVLLGLGGLFLRRRRSV